MVQGPHPEAPDGWSALARALEDEQRRHDRAKRHLDALRLRDLEIRSAAAEGLAEQRRRADAADRLLDELGREAVELLTDLEVPTDVEVMGRPLYRERRGFLGRVDHERVPNPVARGWVIRHRRWSHARMVLSHTGRRYPGPDVYRPRIERSSQVVVLTENGILLERQTGPRHPFGSDAWEHDVAGRSRALGPAPVGIPETTPRLACSVAEAGRMIARYVGARRAEREFDVTIGVRH